MKRLTKVTLLTMAALALTACSQQKPKSSKNASSNQIKTTKVKHGHLSAKKMTPQKTVAIITAYAGKKYSDQWNDSLQEAEKHGLTVKLADQSSYSYMEDGSGVAYMVGKDAGYTLKQDGDETTYYLYGNQKKLATVDMDDMISYLNHRNSDNLVKKLMSSAKIDDERGNDNTASSSSKSDIPGDGGLFQIPANMQGTWYAWDKYDHKVIKMTITQNKISDGKYVSELHKVQKDYWRNHDITKMGLKYADKYKNIARTVWMKNVHGMDWINTQGWFQSAGDGDFYALHTEKGQTVIVSAYGAGLWTGAVYWKSPQLALQYKSKKFSDLSYQ